MGESSEEKHLVSVPVTNSTPRKHFRYKPDVENEFREKKSPF